MSCCRRGWDAPGRRGGRPAALVSEVAQEARVGSGVAVGRWRHLVSVFPIVADGVSQQEARQCHVRLGCNWRFHFIAVVHWSASDSEWILLFVHKDSIDTFWSSSTILDKRSIFKGCYTLDASTIGDIDIGPHLFETFRPFIIGPIYNRVMKIELG